MSPKETVGVKPVHLKGSLLCDEGNRGSSDRLPIGRLEFDVSLHSENRMECMGQTPNSHGFIESIGDFVVALHKAGDYYSMERCRVETIPSPYGICKRVTIGERITESLRCHRSKDLLQ